MNSELKKQYFTDKVHSCEGSIKEVWTIINRLINKRSKTTNISTLLINGTIITESNLIADTINKYFCSIGKELSKHITYKVNPFTRNQTRASDSSLISSSINASHLINAISMVKSWRGFGIDNISSFSQRKGCT